MLSAGARCSRYIDKFSFPSLSPSPSLRPHPPHVPPKLLLSKYCSLSRHRTQRSRHSTLLYVSPACLCSVLRFTFIISRLLHCRSCLALVFFSYVVWNDKFETTELTARGSIFFSIFPRFVASHERYPTWTRTLIYLTNALFTIMTATVPLLL